VDYTAARVKDISKKSVEVAMKTKKRRGAKYDLVA
jgi:hypothetical protein